MDLKRRYKTVFTHRWHDCLCENPKECSKNLEWNSDNSIFFLGNNVNIQKLIYFLYTNNKWVEFEMKNATAFT